MAEDVEEEGGGNFLRNAVIASMLGIPALHPMGRLGYGMLAGLGVRGGKAVGRGAKNLGRRVKKGFNNRKEAAAASKADRKFRESGFANDVSPPDIPPPASPYSEVLRDALEEARQAAPTPQKTKIQMLFEELEKANVDPAKPRGIIYPSGSYNRRV